MKRRFSLFTYPVMDVKAAEAMLNRYAAAGWRLEKIWLGILASFVPAETPVCYCIDWTDPKREDGPDYGALLAEAGWRRHSQVSYRTVYEAPAGATPIQTDSELEYQQFRNKALRRMVIGGAGLLTILAVLLILLFLLDPVFGWERLAGFLAEYNTLAFVLPTLPLLAAGAAAWLMRMGLRLWQWRRCARTGELFPAPGRRSAKLAAICCLLGWLYACALLFPVALDIVDGKVYTGWAIGTIIGGVIALPAAKGPELANRRRYIVLLLPLAAAVLVLPHVAPPGLTDPLCPTRPMAEAQLLPEAERYSVQIEDEASLLVSYTRWQEGRWDNSRYLLGECWNTRSDGLAGRLLEEYRAGLGTANQTPVTGYKDVWLARADLHDGYTEDVWLIRRENCVLEIQTNIGPSDEAWLDGVLAQLEGRT